MKRYKRKNIWNWDGLQEKATNWIWVVLIISAILFLKGLLTEMHTETTRLSDERQRFQKEMAKEREESKELYQEFYAEINESIKKAIEAVNDGEMP